MNVKYKLPKIPHTFFRWYCKGEMYEELHGDLEEFFYERAAEKGLAKARLLYLWDVIRCFQSYAWKIPQSPMNSNAILFKNYFKTSLRSLMKNPMSSFINIFGLSVAIGICLVPYAVVEQDISIDQFHENKDNVYLATFFADRDGEEEQYGQTPTPLGKMLGEDFAHIQKMCRVEDRNVVLKLGDKVFHERIRYVDPEFLEMFTFPLKWGSSGSLAGMNSIIFSEEMSIKYFGGENPVGRDILMIFGEARSKTFTVTGVAEAFPKAHAIEFDFLINFENFATSHPNYDLNDWSGFVNATLIQLDNPSDIRLIEEGMEKYRILQNEVQKDRVISSFAFEQLAVLHRKSRDIRNDISLDTQEEGWVVLSIMGIFILVLACFNYINIAIVSSSKRLKEIAARKVMGANRKGVIIQFLSENVFLTLLALFLGILLGSQIILPWFNQLFANNLELRLLDKNLWIFLSSVSLFTGVVAGLYPAFYISKFEVVKIFRGSVKFGNRNALTKVLLGIQLVLACITISNGVYLTQNNIYQSNRSWGYDQNNVLYVGVPDESAYMQMHAAMVQDPNVLSLSGSSHHLGTSISASVLHMPDRQYDINQLAIDANYFETMGLELVAGRLFNQHHQSDNRSVIVNEVLVKNLAIEQPIGQVFKIDSTRYQVIGVVKDFHFNHFLHKVVPTIFRVASQGDYRYLSMRIRDGSKIATYDELQEQWSAFFPEIPFQGGHQEDVFDSYFYYLDSGAKFMRAFGFIGILLASLGLYGLVTLNVSGRIREFSIRKVLGARLKNITVSITNQYMILFAVSLGIGAPISFVLVETILDTFFEYHMPMNYSGVAISLVILAVVLLATISTQVRKVLKSNPVDGLKVE